MTSSHYWFHFAHFVMNIKKLWNLRNGKTDNINRKLVVWFKFVIRKLEMSRRIGCLPNVKSRDLPGENNWDLWNRALLFAGNSKIISVISLADWNSVGLFWVKSDTFSICLQNGWLTSLSIVDSPNTDLNNVWMLG